MPWGLKNGNHILPSEVRRKAVTCGVRRCPIGHDVFNAQSETGLHVLLLYLSWGTLCARICADSIIEKGLAAERKSEADQEFTFGVEVSN